MTFPVVAIGASAGGLEAILELVGALPPKTGMAYIAVQHLNPNQESLLSEILGKKTVMPVMQVQVGLELQPDHVYLIAPNTSITLADNTIRVLPRESGIHHPADILFTSVARHRAELAIGIVLSGGDSDGALGLRAIKQEGGITFAQEPSSARFPSMPEAAIATGCVDFIQRPSDIAKELVRLARHPSLQAKPDAATVHSTADASKPTEAWETALRRIFRLLRSAHGVDFAHYKRSTLGRRLERRMAFTRAESIDEYIVLLESDAAEISALYHDFLIRVTGFFRDTASFEALAKSAFPRIFEGRAANSPVRIWVPGCATGEEVYSIAIAFKEYWGERRSVDGIQIFGTDVSDAALDKARAGVYLDNIAREVSDERLTRFFVKQDRHYRIAKTIRDLCIFARHDITRDPPFSRLDLLSCRNLLIYLDATAQRRVMESFHYALRPRGFLLLGNSETVGSAASLFDAADQHHRLYTPSASAPGNETHRYGVTASLRPVTLADEAVEPLALETDLAQREADRILLTRFAPASVLIDNALNILQFRGETSPFVEHASGPSSLNLQRVVRSELLVEIAPAIHKARETGAEVNCAPLRLDERPEVNISIVPLRRASPTRCFLILFEGSSPGVVARRAQSVAPLPESEKDRRLTQLEHENASLRDYLQSTLEEHEASQEELRSAHEEVLSANEEFQSTNEELETAKEELQSANEELTTTNEELRQRNRDLDSFNAALNESRQLAERAQAAADIIVESIREPLLVLDDKLRVIRANRAYCAEFEGSDDELEGQLLYHVSAGRWNVAVLRQGLLDVLARGETLEDCEIELSVAGRETQSVSLNARRMTGDDTRAATILLAIADVTARNARAIQAAQEIKRKDEFLAMLAHELRNPLAPISTAVELLRGGPVDPAAQGLHDMIDRQTRRLTRLVDELLDVGRFNRGLIGLDLTAVDLVKLLQQACATMQSQVAQRQQELIPSLPDAAVVVEGDALRLEQVFTNLLENASKYTELGGRIRVTLAQTPSHALITVADDGIGLEPDSLDKIFGLFTQVQPPDQGGAGLGIGLTLVRRVIELHGGRVEARSEGLGRGSEFLVYLPKSSALVGGPERSSDPVDKRLSSRASGRRVLIVDDNEDARQALALLLRSWGYDVGVAADGSSAIELAAQFQPQVALLDIGMPGMNGYQLARYLRSSPTHASMQLIAMSGFGRDEDRRAAIAAGFDHHLVKPLVSDTLAALLAPSG